MDKISLRGIWPCFFFSFLGGPWGGDDLRMKVIWVEKYMHINQLLQFFHELTGHLVVVVVASCYPRGQHGASLKEKRKQS